MFLCSDCYAPLVLLIGIWTSGPYLLAFCRFCLVLGFTPSCRFLVASHLCLCFVHFCLTYTCTALLRTCMLCHVNTISLFFPPLPYAGSLHLCLFNHTSYLIPHHHNWLENNRHKLKCCDVIYFVFSLVNSKPVYFKCDFPLVQIILWDDFMKISNWRLIWAVTITNTQNVSSSISHTVFVFAYQP